MEISRQIIVRICLCIGGYYATLIHIYIVSLLVEGFHPGGVSWMSTSLSSGGCCREAVDGWPSRNGLTCGGTKCERSILGTRCHVCVRVVYENGT